VSAEQTSTSILTDLENLLKGEALDDKNPKTAIVKQELLESKSNNLLVEFNEKAQYID